MERRAGELGRGGGGHWLGHDVRWWGAEEVPTGGHAASQRRRNRCPQSGTHESRPSRLHELSFHRSAPLSGFSRPLKMRAKDFEPSSI